MRSPMQTQTHLWREMPDMGITTITVTVMGKVLGEVIMDIMALAVTMIHHTITVEIMMVTAGAMGSIKLSKEQGSKKLKYLKGKIS